MACIAMGSPAKVMAAVAPGREMRIAGFVGAKSANNRGIRLHVTEIEILEGNDNGIQTEGR